MNFNQFTIKAPEKFYRDIQQATQGGVQSIRNRAPAQSDTVKG